MSHTSPSNLSVKVTAITAERMERIELQSDACNSMENMDSERFLIFWCSLSIDVSLIVPSPLHNRAKCAEGMEPPLMIGNPDGNYFVL
jgi:hypothetical protein